MPIYSYLAIPIGYLLGAIPSAYIIGKLWGKTDIRTEGDGRISAAAVKKRVGRWAFLLVVTMDVSKGIVAIIIAKVLVGSPVVDEFVGNMALIPLLVTLATGFVTVVGHSWSPFISFQGGLGATVIYGVLAGMVFWPQELIALVIGGITVLATRKSGFSTGVIIIVLSIVLLIQKLFGILNVPPMSIEYRNMSPLLIVYPLILILLMVAKRFQVSKTRGAKTHDLLEYWKNNSK